MMQFNMRKKQNFDFVRRVERFGKAGTVWCLQIGKLLFTFTRAAP